MIDKIEDSDIDSLNVNNNGGIFASSSNDKRIPGFKSYEEMAEFWTDKSHITNIAPG
jgi:hypothetical protein